MAYKDMPNCQYLTCVFVLYAIELLMACLLADISLVFSFISAFAVSALAFWFPGYYYLMSVEKYGKSKAPDAAAQRNAKILAGVGYFQPD